MAIDWQDRGVVLSWRRFGESDALIQALTLAHGRHAGLVRGGAGRRARPLLQPGNLLLLTWKARLADQLGHFTAEALRLHAGRVLADPARLAALGSACALIAASTAEREPVPRLFEALVWLLERLAAADSWPSDYVRFEAVLLEELGFGLDLASCAVTGGTLDLAYVSPRTGRAVSRAAAGDWAPRLLPLPAFLLQGGEGDAAAVVQGLRLTGSFLRRHVFAPNELALPPARERLVTLLGGPAS
jgi:DNA repair protein RecO (recombination protein O)